MKFTQIQKVLQVLVTVSRILADCLLQVIQLNNAPVHGVEFEHAIFLRGNIQIQEPGCMRENAILRNDDLVTFI